MKKIVTAILISLLLITACKTSTVIYNSDSSIAAHDADLDTVRTTIIESLSKRRWEILQEEPGMFRAGINVRSHYAEIIIRYSATDLKINYVKSSNLDYNASSNKIHRNYNKWVRNIEQDVIFGLQTKNYVSE